MLFCCRSEDRLASVCNMYANSIHSRDLRELFPNKAEESSRFYFVWWDPASRADAKERLDWLHFAVCPAGKKNPHKLIFRRWGSSSLFLCMLGLCLINLPWCAFAFRFLCESLFSAQLVPLAHELITCINQHAVCHLGCQETRVELYERNTIAPKLITHSR